MTFGYVWKRLTSDGRLLDPDENIFSRMSQFPLNPASGFRHRSKEDALLRLQEIKEEKPLGSPLNSTDDFVLLEILSPFTVD